MAKFSYLTIERKYDIIDAETGHWLTHDMRGGVALASDWPEGAEAWPAGEREFNGKPEDVATTIKRSQPTERLSQSHQNKQVP
jgi:hypothetical protein